MNTIRALNGLDPDQDQRSVGPDMGPNCLQRLSADDKSMACVERVNMADKSLQILFFLILEMDQHYFLVKTLAWSPVFC